MPVQMKLTAITLDCPDPLALLAFYRQATGLAAHPESDARFAGVTREDGLFIGFQRVDGYQAPRWPDQTVPQQLHLDFAGKPIADRTLTFSGGGTSCTLTTDAHGTATCRGLLGGLLGYDVKFTGDAIWAPSSAHGGLL